MSSEGDEETQRTRTNNDCCIVWSPEEGREMNVSSSSRLTSPAARREPPPQVVRRTCPRAWVTDAEVGAVEQRVGECGPAFQEDDETA